MARKSKATLTRLQNLTNASGNSTANDTSELDDSDSEYIPLTTPNLEKTGVPQLRDFFEALDKDGYACESDFESDSESSELGGSEEEEIRDDAALLTFIAVMQKAQEVATAAERERNRDRKRPKHYSGNSI